MFDNTMSAGTVAIIGWLFLLTVVMILSVSLALTLLGVGPHENAPGFWLLVWMSLLRTLDPGTMGGDEGNILFLAGMLIVTMGGIFIVSTLIGALSTGMREKLDDLRKGRSFVLEVDHTIILGWSPEVFKIISELVLANANQKRACIALLANEDKVLMEDEIRARVPRTMTTRIVCRTGDPFDPTDLEIVNPASARAIIILNSGVPTLESPIIKTVLALINTSHRRPEPYHLVAEVRDRAHVDVVRMIGQDEVTLVFRDDLIARIIAQTSRRSGLSVIYHDLLTFQGDEIYFHEEPGLVGKTFGEALLAYEDSVPIGLHFRDGHVKLNPPMETRIAPGDQVIAISEDDDTVRLSGLHDYPIDTQAICAPHEPPLPPERTLILGWNHRAPMIIQQLESYMAAGSEVVVVADLPDEEAAQAEQCACSFQNTRIKVQFHRASTTDRATLERLQVTSYDYAILLSYSDMFTPQQADGVMLIALLHLRDIVSQAGHTLPIVSEMQDDRNRELAGVTIADDFIVSDELVSLMLSQISQQKHLSAVFDDLFDPEGSELYIQPARFFVTLNRPVTFYTVVEAARRSGKIAIGYRLMADAHNAQRAYGVVLNPPKSQRVQFCRDDKIIVLAEAEAGSGATPPTQSERA